jgi:hypothetical protein
MQLNNQMSKKEKHQNVLLEEQERESLIEAVESLYSIMAKSALGPDADEVKIISKVNDYRGLYLNQSLVDLTLYFSREDLAPFQDDLNHIELCRLIGYLCQDPDRTKVFLSFLAELKKDRRS